MTVYNDYQSVDIELDEGLWAETCYKVYVTYENLTNYYSDLFTFSNSTKEPYEDYYFGARIYGEEYPDSTVVEDCITAASEAYEYPRE